MKYLNILKGKFSLPEKSMNVERKAKRSNVLLWSYGIELITCSEMTDVFTGHCLECNNFNSMFAIISGLGHGSVSRLRQTWDRLPSKWIKLFEVSEI